MTDLHLPEGLKAIPPASVSGVSLFGIPLNEWTYIATLLYIVVQIGLLIYKTVKSEQRKDKRNDRQHD